MNAVENHSVDLNWPIVGHQQAVEELRAAVERGPHHAYVITGHESLGKTTLAITFAQAILCSNPIAPGVPCGECSACRRVSRGVHPDCSYWDLERQAQSSEKSSISRNLSLNIQTVREISASLAMRPLESRYRIVIVNDVETMQEAAQEAFLKTLEEPPAYAVIVLITKDADLLLETIRSRTVTISLGPVAEGTIQDRLEHLGADTQMAHQIASASDGRPGWAIRAKTNPAMLTERIEQLAQADQWIDADHYHRLVEANKIGDAFSKDREAVYTILLAVQRQWRQRLMLDIEAAAPNIGALVDALRSIDTCFRDLDANVRPKLALESMVMQWPQMDR